jgi:hypothetical protein
MEGKEEVREPLDVMSSTLIEVQQTLHEKLPLGECPEGPEFVGNILQPTNREAQCSQSLFVRRELIRIAVFNKLPTAPMSLQRLGNMIEQGEPGQQSTGDEDRGRGGGQDKARSRNQGKEGGREGGKDLERVDRHHLFFATASLSSSKIASLFSSSSSSSCSSLSSPSSLSS